MDLEVLSALKKNNVFRSLNLSNDTLTFEVLSSGKLRNIALKQHKEDAALLNYIRTVVQNLPGKWLPALASPMDVLEMELSEEEHSLKIRVNSRVELPL